MNSKYSFKCSTQRHIFLSGVSVLLAFLCISKYFYLPAFADERSGPQRDATEITYTASMDIELKDSPNLDPVSVVDDNEPQGQEIATPSLLTSTGDATTYAIFGMFLFASCLYMCISLSRRRVEARSNDVVGSNSLNLSIVSKRFMFVVLSVLLLAGTIFSGIKAFADWTPEYDKQQYADCKSKVTVDDNGKILSADYTINNKLENGNMLWGMNIEAPVELEGWTTDLVEEEGINNGGSISGKWIPNSENIPNTLLTKLKNGESVHLNYSYTVKFEGLEVAWLFRSDEVEDYRCFIALDYIPWIPSVTPTKEHYVFKEWNTDPDGLGDVVDQAYLDNHPMIWEVGYISYYAIWKGETHSIEYKNIDGSSLPEGKSNPSTYEYGKGVTSFESPVKTGYEFDGWYDSETGGNKVTNIGANSLEDITLWAHWTPITYSVKFDKNEASATGSMSNLTLTYDQDQTLTANAFSCVSKDFIGWAERSDGDVMYNNVQIVKNLTSTKNDTVILYAKWKDKDPVTITYDATGGDGASKSGHFQLEVGVDAYRDVDQLTEDVIPRHPLQGPKFNGNLIKPIPDYPELGYAFMGWYSKPNGEGDLVEFGKTVALENTTYYAYYLNNTFMAQTSNVANPRTISGDKFSLNWLKTASVDIATNGSNSEYYSLINDWMTNDSYHLYTLLKSGDSYLDASKSDNWVEFRIIHVGQHDSDGSGITFQAVHMLPKAYQMNSTATNSGGWASSNLKASMNSGEIYNMFDSMLTGNAKELSAPSSKGKLWLASFSELSGGTSVGYMGNGNDGSQYAYWKSKNIVANGSNSVLTLTGTRSSKIPELMTSRFSSCWWERLRRGDGSNAFLYVGSNGNLFNGDIANNYMGVVPCFAL